MKRTISVTTLFLLFTIGAIAADWCHVSSCYYNLVWNQEELRAEIRLQYYAKSGPETMCQELQNEANMEAIEAIGRTGLLSRLNVRIKYKPGDFTDIVSIDLTNFQPYQGCEWNIDDARDYSIHCVRRSIQSMELHQVMRIEIYKDEKFGILPVSLSNSL